VNEAFPFAATDDSGLANSARDFGAALTKLLGMQMTGGSTTVPDGFVKMREAGAVARETLKEAASRRTGVPRDQLATDNGAVLLPTGERIPYTDLAMDAAAVEPVTDVALRPADQWRYIGKDMLRTDIPGKSTGTERYGIDVMMDNMLYATVRTNPGIGAPLNSYDDRAAKSMRGVKKVVEISNGVGVIADNTWRAFKAANAITVDWGEPDYPPSSDEMWDVLAKSFTEDYREVRFKNDGDAEQAVAAAGEVLEAQYRVPFLAHAPLEPMNATVLVADDRVDIWTGTQIPGYLQGHAAKVAGVDKDAVFVHVLPIGGSFGRRLDDTYAIQAVEVAMAVKGTPVKMTWTREEDMLHDYPRPAQMARARGVVKSGKVDTYDLSVASDSAATSWLGNRLGIPLGGPDMTIVAGSWDQPFAIPNYRVTAYRAPVNLPIGFWRSVGASGNGFLHNGFLDELIHAAGADPLQELIRLCNHDVSRHVLETVGEMCQWQGRYLGENRGRGLAYTLSFGVPVAAVVDVTNTEQGIRIDDVYMALDVGTVVDPINFEAQVSGGIIFALAHAMNCELTYEDYRPQQTNFHAYQGMRLYQAPRIQVKGLEMGEEVRGVGEPSVPPTAPALANAIFAATGQRIRELPLNKEVQFA
jgi:isoquinoline 1-oxidoreductase beta subunit